MAAAEENWLALTLSSAIEIAEGVMKADVMVA